MEIQDVIEDGHLAFNILKETSNGADIGELEEKFGHKNTELTINSLKTLEFVKVENGNIKTNYSGIESYFWKKWGSEQNSLKSDIKSDWPEDYSKIINKVSGIITRNLQIGLKESHAEDLTSFLDEIDQITDSEHVIDYLNKNPDDEKMKKFLKTYEKRN